MNDSLKQQRLAELLKLAKQALVALGYAIVSKLEDLEEGYLVQKDRVQFLVILKARNLNNQTNMARVRHERIENVKKANTRGLPVICAYGGRVEEESSNFLLIFNLADVGIVGKKVKTGFNIVTHEKGRKKLREQILQMQNEGKIAHLWEWVGDVENAPLQLPGADYVASDIEDSPETQRRETTTSRIIRNTQVAKQVKAENGGRCQHCETELRLPNGENYAEAHHIRPLGKPHNGDDARENLICVCPNCHALLDFFAIPLDKREIRNGESIADKNIAYHNAEHAKAWKK